jgi:hypothetical protein
VDYLIGLRFKSVLTKPEKVSNSIPNNKIVPCSVGAKRTSGVREIAE